MKRIVAVVAGFATAGALIVSVPAASGAPVQPTDDWVPAQIQPTTLPLYWSRATLDDAVKVDRLGRRPVVDLDKRVWILACERDVQLDCVESIGLVDAEGLYRPGTLDRGVTFDAYRSDGVRPYAEHHQIWNVPGLMVNGKEADVEIAMGMGGREGHGFPGLNMGMNLSGVDLVQPAPNDPFGCRFVDRGTCYNPPVFPDGTVMRIVMRVSWLAPSAITVRGTGVNVSVEPLRSGARKITITGAPMLLQSQGGMKEILSGKPQWVTSSFDFGMYDPRIESTPGGECAINDPIILANNAQGAGLPTWNSSEGRLNLQMSAPHYWADGQREWRGFYETAISGEVARCMWGVNPEVTNYISLEVYDADGEEKAATTAIGYRDDYISIRAYDFTFSSNTVSAQVNVRPGQKCFTRGVAIKDLVCAQKGKKLVWTKRKR